MRKALATVFLLLATILPAVPCFAAEHRTSDGWTIKNGVNVLTSHPVTKLRKKTEKEDSALIIAWDETDNILSFRVVIPNVPLKMDKPCTVTFRIGETTVQKEDVLPEQQPGGKYTSFLLDNRPYSDFQAMLDAKLFAAKIERNDGVKGFYPVIVYLKGIKQAAKEVAQKMAKANAPPPIKEKTSG